MRPLQSRPKLPLSAHESTPPSQRTPAWRAGPRINGCWHCCCCRSRIWLRGRAPPGASKRPTGRGALSGGGLVSTRCEALSVRRRACSATAGLLGSLAIAARVICNANLSVAPWAATSSRHSLHRRISPSPNAAANARKCEEFNCARAPHVASATFAKSTPSPGSECGARCPSEHAASGHGLSGRVMVRKATSNLSTAPRGDLNSGSFESNEPFWQLAPRPGKMRHPSRSGARGKAARRQKRLLAHEIAPRDRAGARLIPEQGDSRLGRSGVLGRNAPGAVRWRQRAVGNAGRHARRA